MMPGRRPPRGPGGPGGPGFRPGGFRDPRGPRGFHRPPPPPPPPPYHRPYRGGCVPGCLMYLLGAGAIVAALVALIL